ncbi:MAG TPA: choice-of-anchor J domain-containing protein [Bacteroidia bacterium]|nr:choice-of-anchor J domain-containing protein [Bacteroidia bacterium]
MKKLFSTLIIISSSTLLSGQIIFQEKFNGLSLSTYTTLYTTTLYTTVPSGFIEMSDGFPNTKGSSLHPNAPFHTDSLRYKGWGVVYNNAIKDTFLVSTSWIDSNRSISRWIILPVINGISNNSVLHWKAMAPDPTFADGYAVYITTNTSINDTAVFTSSTKVFQLNDNSTSGGGEKQEWTHRSISLANYVGQSIRVAFKNISRQKYQLWIDDITVENLPYAYDASLQNIGNPKYVLINQPFFLKTKVINNGYQSLSNINLAYSIQGITYNNQSFALSSSLNPLATNTVAFTNTISINTAGIYKVKIWVNQVNGQTDQNHFNDTISYYLSVLSNSISPKIILEQITDASFPDAPANSDTLINIMQQDTNIIPIQIHQYDSLKTNIANLHTKFFNLPDNQLAILLNRNYSLDKNKNYFFRNELRQNISTLKSSIAPCEVYITNLNVDTNSRNIQFDVSAKFFQDAKGKYFINAYLVENTIHGNPADTTINGYNQLSNFYYTPYSNYYQQGYFSNAANAFVLNAYQYKHSMVLENATNGIYGDGNVIPNNPTINTLYTKSYSLNIPTSANNVFRYNFRNMYIVAFVYEHDTLIENRKILNATKIKVLSTPEFVSVSEVQKKSDVILYPNPADKFIYIQTKSYQKMEGKILNVLGQEMICINSEIIDISMLPEGYYTVILNIDNKIFSKKLIIKR